MEEQVNETKKQIKFNQGRSSFTLSPLYALAFSMELMASSKDFPEFRIFHKDSPLASIATIPPNIAAAKPRFRRDDRAVKIRIASSNLEANPPPPLNPDPYLCLAS